MCEVQGALNSLAHRVEWNVEGSRASHGLCSSFLSLCVPLQLVTACAMQAFHSLFHARPGLSTLSAELNAQIITVRPVGGVWGHCGVGVPWEAVLGTLALCLVYRVRLAGLGCPSGRGQQKGKEDWSPAIKFTSVSPGAGTLTLDLVNFNELFWHDLVVVTDTLSRAFDLRGLWMDLGGGTDPPNC